MALTFGLTWDYRCPFARIAHAHVLDGLAAGADWDVRFVPFSLGQAHVGPGETPIWERPDDDTGLLALQAGVVVRDTDPGRFLAVHRGLFEARHEHGRHLRDRDVVADVLASNDVDVDKVFEVIATGEPLATVRHEHEAAVTDFDVWGVPTFLADGRAAFVRLMERPTSAEQAVRTVERIVDLLTGWPELNEFKHTSLQR